MERGGQDLFSLRVSRQSHLLTSSSWHEHGTMGEVSSPLLDGNTAGSLVQRVDRPIWLNIFASVVYPASVRLKRGTVNALS